MDDQNLKFVDFYTHCATCKYADLSEVKDPCNECLDVGAREGTDMPEKWEAKA